MAFTTIGRQAMTTQLTLPENILTELSKEGFSNALLANKGVFIMKFGAEWCGPCKKIDPVVYEYMNRLPTGASGAVIDIDESFELYAFLKSKRVVNGVPVILCYKKGNYTWVPDSVVVGADEPQVRVFFENAFKLIN
jgi:thioredoxin 1